MLESLKKFALAHDCCLSAEITGNCLRVELASYDDVTEVCHVGSASQLRALLGY